ncbi:hypothetical protein F8538_07720 [Edwardsiella ictaluri]|uniref:hypothetical protein n=1 Tax=Edwardsiella ictaluri TaxID=67780 RepID=UPI0018DB7CCB|nr:hypothetical protein [Edwardsiella ictaluri]QPW26719.1 hypothetical protein F8538_07720 [Edwardsiella ictaluri]
MALQSNSLYNYYENNDLQKAYACAADVPSVKRREEASVHCCLYDLSDTSEADITSRILVSVQREQTKPQRTDDEIKKYPTALDKLASATKAATDVKFTDYFTGNSIS